MEFIRHMSELDRFNMKIAGTVSSLKLETPTVYEEGWFFKNADWKATARQVLNHNNTVYRNQLPEAVAVSASVANCLAVQQTHCHREAIKLGNVYSKDSGISLLEYLGHSAATFIAPNPLTGYGAFKSVRAHFNAEETYRASLEKLWETRNPVLWAYRLTLEDDQFLLRRGKWDIATATYSLPDQYGTVQFDTFQATVIDVGVDDGVRRRLQPTPTCLDFDLTNPRPGKYRLTCTSWVPRDPDP
jgi:hypothetical protein